MKSVFSAITVALVFGSTLTWAECERPEAPSMPNGSKASEQQMIEGQQNLKQYMAAGEKYLACIDQQEKAAIEVDTQAAKPASEKVSAKRAAAHISAYNETVDELEAKAIEFNTQLKAYRKAQAK